MSCRRNCYYDAERYLSLFKVYSERNCFVDCAANYSLQVCGCVTFQTPRTVDTKICSMRQQGCLKRALAELKGDSLVRVSGHDICDCKPACTSLTFEAETHYSPADTINYMYEGLGIRNTES